MSTRQRRGFEQNNCFLKSIRREAPDATEKEVTYESRAAEAVATKATQEVINTVKKNIEE